jgi:signal transduction histidine kinase
MEIPARILIIDDEEVVLDSCKGILEGSGADIRTASDGTEGLRLVRDFQPDLVFVDLKMPGISGFEVMDAIQEIGPDIVSIVITGYATVSSAVDAMKRGAYDFLPKPFTPEEFRIITRRGLEKRRLQTEMLALRKEKEMLRENFVALVSHELKSPLAAVQQNLLFLIQELSGKLDDAEKGRLQRMKARIDELIQLVKTWTRLSSQDLAGIRERFHPVNLGDVIAQALDIIQPQATRKNITITVSFDESQKPVLGDEGTLVEAVVNILGNAVKYSYDGKQVWLDSKPVDGGTVIQVRDEGVGISREDLPFVFQDFYVGRTVGAEPKGSGLGLAISRRIIGAHGGSISVESEPGKGSSFTIRLPAGDPLEAADTHERERQRSITLEPKKGGNR